MSSAVKFQLNILTGRLGMSRKGLIYPDYSLVYILDRILSFGSLYAKVRKDRWSKERMLHKVRHWKTKRAIEEDRTVWNIESFPIIPKFSDVYWIKFGA